MRFKLFLAAILALVPMPALADVTARYAAGSKELVVEVDEGGNSRIDVEGKFAILRRDGVDYIVVQDKDGPKVFELKAMADMIKGFIPKTEDEEAKKVRFALVPGVAAAVGGQQGMGWNLTMQEGPADSKKKHIAMLVSADPRLVPVGDVFRRTMALVTDFFGAIFPPETGFTTGLTDLFAKGTPLSITPVEEGAAKPEGPLIEFKSLDTAEIDAKHFELPAPVTPAEEIFGSMDALLKPGGGAIESLP